METKLNIVKLDQKLHKHVALYDDRLEKLARHYAHLSERVQVIEQFIQLSDYDKSAMGHINTLSNIQHKIEAFENVLGVNKLAE